MTAQGQSAGFQAYRLPVLFLLLAIAWAALTLTGTLEAFDQVGVRMFRSDAAGTDPIGAGWVVPAVKGLTHIGDTITLIVLSLATIGWLVKNGQRSAAIYFLVMTAGSFLLSGMLKSIFGRARPDIVDHLVHAGSASFPSGHTLRSAVVFLGLLLIARLYSPSLRGSGLAAIVCLLFIAIGLSRVFLGVHWPSDIIFGWLIAGFWVSLWAPKLRQQGA